MNPLKAHATAFRALGEALVKAEDFFVEREGEKPAEAASDMNALLGVALLMAADDLEAQIPTLAEGPEVTWNPKGKA